MAVTSAKNPREIIYGTDIGTPANTAGTAQQAQQQASTYKPSAQVQQAQQQMQQIQAAKPQGYSSKYDAQLQSILQQIQNPEKFQYNFNDDELFKYYADLYSQKGKQASMDAMGQAAALTGGYGNSYAQQAGNQAYDQYMLSLYDKGMDLRDRAYQQYQDMLANQYNQYNVLSQADQTDYGRYRDTYGDWQNELAYYTDLYNNEYNRDYTKFTDQRAYDENVRQFNESLDWEKMSTEQKYAADYAMQLLAIGQMPSDELLAAAGLSAADAQLILAPMLATAGGGGGTGGSNKYYVDEYGYTYSLGKDGKATYVNPNSIKGTDKIEQTKGTTGAAAFYQSNPYMQLGNQVMQSLTSKANNQTTKAKTKEEKQLENQRKKGV